MSKLLEHFKAMQEMARTYIEPDNSTYTDRDGTVHSVNDRSWGFAGDMIYMLDGPEQRDAEADEGQRYPTEDAFMAATRALNWRHAELRHHGIDFITLPEDAPQYPPEDYDFGPNQYETLVKQLLATQSALGAETARAKQAEADLAAALSRENELRDRLMASELAYAKVSGYLDRIEDERPPVMIPQQRERFGARMPDGTMGTIHQDWRGSPSRAWYHK